MSFRRFFRCGGGAFTPAPTPTPTPSPAALLSGDTSRLSTSAATKRTAIINKVSAEKWAGYNNQGFAYTTTVNNIAALKTAAKFASDNYSGAGQWSKITCISGGDYATDVDFQDAATHLGPAFAASGGLLITTDNTDPLITGQLALRGRYIEVNGLKLGRCANSSFGGVDAAITIGGTTPALLKFKNNRIGAYYNGGKSLADWNTFSLGIYSEFAEQILLEGNTFRWTNRSVSNYNCRIVEAVGNDFSECVQNAFSTSPYTPESSWYSFKGIFADDDCWHWLHHNTHRGAPDIADTLGSPHNDWNQILDLTGYQQGHTAVGTMPPPPGTLRQVIENNILTSFATKTYSDGTMPAINIYIPTDGNAPHQAVVFNNIQAGPGVPAQDYGTVGDVWVECNDSGPCGPLPSTLVFNSASNAITAQNAAIIHAAKNILRSNNAADTSQITDTTSLFMDDRDTATSPFRPSDRWVGPFTTANGRYVLSVADLRAMDQATFRATMIAAYVKQAAGSGSTWI